MPDLYIGLMSGTSLDGVDGVLVDFSEPPLTVLAHASVPFAPDLTRELLALNTPGHNELHRCALAANALVRIYAEVVADLLSRSGLAPEAIAAIGAHGQTVRHQPQAFDGVGYTAQLNNPALLVELTRIRVVADFRSRDVAAGGQGAPLVPPFHQAVFGVAGQTVCVLNVGGISNLTVLGPRLADDVLGFDCGPGNALLDAWCQQHLGQAFDAEGAWAASGQVDNELLSVLLAEPYFSTSHPKSTGRDLFNPSWLARQLEKVRPLAPADVQATLTELTALVCANDAKLFGSDGRDLIVCGGGAYNRHLVQRLQAHLPTMSVQSSMAHGLPPLQVEAAAFAWLAQKATLLENASLKTVTGARGARVLGGIYPV